MTREAGVFEVWFARPLGGRRGLVVRADTIGGLVRQVKQFCTAELDRSGRVVVAVTPEGDSLWSGVVYQHMRGVVRFTVEGSEHATLSRMVSVPGWGKPARDRVRLERVS